MWLANWLFKQKRTKAQMISYYKEVFGRGYAGQYVLADICRHGFLDQNTFNPESARLSDFNEGRRAMALHILNTIGLNPNDYVNQFHFASNMNQEGDMSDVD